MSAGTEVLFMNRLNRINNSWCSGILLCLSKEQKRHSRALICHSRESGNPERKIYGEPSLGEKEWVG